MIFFYLDHLIKFHSANFYSTGINYSNKLSNQQSHGGMLCFGDMALFFPRNSNIEKNSSKSLTKVLFNYL